MLQEQEVDRTKPSASLRGVSTSAEKDLQLPGIFLSKYIAKCCVNTWKESYILRHPSPVPWGEWQARENTEREEMVSFSLSGYILWVNA